MIEVSIQKGFGFSLNDYLLFLINLRSNYRKAGKMDIVLYFKYIYTHQIVKNHKCN